jgi:hypothetical protein
MDRDRERMVNYTAMLNDAESDAQMLRQRWKALQEDQRRLGKDNADMTLLLAKTRDVRGNCK